MFVRIIESKWMAHLNWNSHVFVFAMSNIDQIKTEIHFQIGWFRCSVIFWQLVPRNQMFRKHGWAQQFRRLPLPEQWSNRLLYIFVTSCSHNTPPLRCSLSIKYLTSRSQIIFRFELNASEIERNSMAGVAAQLGSFVFRKTFFFGASFAICTFLLVVHPFSMWQMC